MATKRRSSNPSKKNRWADHYTQKAKKEGYPARSAYKLKALDQKFNLIRPGHKILDLGCAPGSWLLYAAKQATPTGRVWGVDLKAVTIALPDHVTTVVADVFDLDALFWEKAPGPFDLILSDMAPATTGNKNTDTARSEGLCESALLLAKERLKKTGAVAFKIFQGPGLNSFREEMRRVFKRVDLFKPSSSRKASKEIYLVGREFTSQPPRTNT